MIIEGGGSLGFDLTPFIQAAVSIQMSARKTKLKIERSFGFSMLSIELPMIRKPNKNDKCS
jgi:hypothetical protein